MKDFIKDAKDRYREAVDGWSHIYKAASDDLRFVYDVDEGQWPDAIRRQREKDGRPVLTVNKLQKYVRQNRGGQMQNRPRMKVIPVDSKSDPKMAELYNGLIRQIEYLSRAEIAYDTAYNHSISGSVGFFRINTEYEDYDSFNQIISIKRIINPLSVHFDPYAQEFCLEDAQYCFVEDLLSQDTYKKLYPKSEIQDFDSSSTATLFGDWMKGDKIRIAEYYYKDTKKRKIVLLDSGQVIPIDEKITIDAIKASGRKIVKERTVDIPVVKWAKINGVEKLEETEWAGSGIPIIPVFGDEVVSEGKRYYLSLARGAKGPQQMYNYWCTAATETIALAPKMPFIVDHRQVKNFEQEWEDANTQNRMYIRYNAVAGLQKPSREPQAQLPSAIINMMQQTQFDIEDHLGMYEATMGQESNERSGKAINARVAQADKGTYTFAQNLTWSIIAAGRQIIDLVPKIYDTERALRVMGEDGSQGVVEVNKPALMPDGAPGKLNDLSVGKYDLIATIGASYSSKRQEMVQALMEACQYAPTVAPYIIPLIFKYSDWPGSEEVYTAVQQGVQQAQQAEALNSVK